MKQKGWIVVLIVVLALSPLVGTNPSVTAKEESRGILVKEGVTQPVFSYRDAIRETVYVEVPVDSDEDGEKDRIAADIIRPQETEQGLKVPVIYEMSPYRAGLNEIPFHDVDVELTPVEGRGGKPTPGAVGKDKSEEDEPKIFPGYYDNYFVPRGYAVVLAEGLGTGRSTGCPTTGDKNEVMATRAVIDWLNGRAQAFNAEGEPVTADWSTGETGMIGVSYNGTLPNAVATTGVEGLKTIVPIGAISSWYDYYRANGAVVAPGGYQGEDADVLAKAVLTREQPEACTDRIDKLTRKQDRRTGDGNDFWKERDYLRDAKKIEASVFAVHGLNDWNVKTKHVSRWWEALSKYEVPRKIWLHRGGHLDPFHVRHQEWMTTLHRWFDHWLYGVDNGIMNEPMADIEQAPGEWETQRNWPDPDARSVSLHLSAGDGEEPGGLRLHPLSGSPQEKETWTDDASLTAEELVKQPTTPSPHRLVYLTDKLDQPLRISGTPEIRIRASIDRPAANLTALLVDYGTDTRVDDEAGLEKTGERVCYGEGIPGDEGCTDLYRHRTHTRPFEIVTRGWLDPQNRHHVSRSKPVKPGKEYTFRWDLQPDDYVFKKGHRIGVVLIASDHDYTLRPSPGTQITILPGRSQLILPVVGGLDPFSNN